MSEYYDPFEDKVTHGDLGEVIAEAQLRKLGYSVININNNYKKGARLLHKQNGDVFSPGSFDLENKILSVEGRKIDLSKDRSMNKRHKKNFGISISPDLLAYSDRNLKNGFPTCFFTEVKTKDSFTYTWTTGIWETGFDVSKFNIYYRFAKSSFVPVYIMFCHFATHNLENHEDGGISPTGFFLTNINHLNKKKRKGKGKSHNKMLYYWDIKDLNRIG